MRRPHRTKRLVNHLSSPDNVEVRVEPFSIKISYGRKQRPVSFKLVLVAACALVDADGRVLLTERPAGKSMAGLWEFPGGKIEAGERPEDTLIRELNEELGIVVRNPCRPPLPFGSHAYDDSHLLMPLY